MVRISIVALALACLAACSLHVFRSEADEAAQRFIEKSFSKCGDSYLGTIPGRRWAIYSQVKGLTVTTESQDLSPADKLNGYQWIGQIWIGCSAVRDFGKFSGWSPEWAPGSSWCGGLAVATTGDAIPLCKRDGKWFVFGKWEEASYNPKKIDCGEIPPGR
jgi:hypothetical protein